MFSFVRHKNSSLDELLKKDSKGFIKIASLDELEINEMKVIKVKGKEILLCRSEHGYVALQDKCTYKSDSLTRGVMIAGTLQCLNHGCQFDIHTGQVKKGPAKKMLKKYPVFERENGVFLKF
jgi:nitrite reductase/ring-hydroxylating ferredoxin subunit